MALDSAREFKFPGNFHSGAMPRHTFRVPGLCWPWNQGFLMHQNKKSRKVLFWCIGQIGCTRIKWPPIPKLNKFTFWSFLSPRLHFWISNFWWYSNLPYSYDLEHILNGVPGLDLLLNVEIWNWILSFSYFWDLYCDKCSKNIVLHWTMITDRFPIILKSLRSHSGPISI